MQGEARKSIGNPARIACALLVSAIVCACLVVGVSARFASEGEAEDEARVATFSIDASGSVLEQSIEADLVPGGSIPDTSLKIENNSEVDMEYTVTVNNETRNLPLELTLRKTGSSEESKAFNSPVSLNGHLEVGSSVVDGYTLSIKWPTSAGAGAGADPIDPRDPDYIGMVDRIVIKVEARQAN